MTNKAAIEYASRNSFLALYKKGGIDTIDMILQELDKWWSAEEDHGSDEVLYAIIIMFLTALKDELKEG